MKTGVRLELLIDIEIMNFCEFAIGGGVYQCYHRYTKANNVYMGSDINPQEEIKYFNDINKLIIYRAGPCHSIYHLEISIGLKT